MLFHSFSRSLVGKITEIILKIPTVIIALDISLCFQIQLETSFHLGHFVRYHAHKNDVVFRTLLEAIISSMVLHLSKVSDMLF